MYIDWTSLGWYHVGEWYTSSSGHTYRLTEHGWTNCPECLTLPTDTTETTGASVTITAAPSLTTETTAVPEASSAMLLLVALAGVVLWQRVRRTTAT